MPVFPPATLTYPANGASNVPVPVTFRWTPSDAAPKQPYAPQVLFITLSSDVDWNGGLQIPLGPDVDSHTVGSLSPGVSYKWKVVTFWDSPLSAYSESDVFTFTASTTVTPPSTQNMWPIMLIAGAALVALFMMSRQEQQQYR
jgi:hypothetical protein